MLELRHFIFEFLQYFRLTRNPQRRLLCSPDDWSVALPASNAIASLLATPPQTDSNASFCSTVRTLLFEAHKSRLRHRERSIRTLALDNPETKALAERLAADSARTFSSCRGAESMSPVRTPSGVIGIARRTLPSLTEALTSPQALVVVAHDVQEDARAMCGRHHANSRSSRRHGIHHHHIDG